MARELTISAVVLARNEEDRLSRALSSLGWVDQIIVIDNDSSDQTFSIAKKFQATIVKSGTQSFAQLRNEGLHEARGKWLLYLDADEIVTPNLAREIRHVITASDSPAHAAYFIFRENYYLGRRWPCQDKVQRLFVRKSLTGWTGDLHESPTIYGSTGSMLAPLQHYTHRSLEEMVAKTNEWSVFEARLRFNANHPLIVWWRFGRVMMVDFIRVYIGQSGWKAGVIGIIESMYQAFSIFISYAKLYELQRNAL